MDDKKIIIIGTHAAHVRLAHNLKSYYSEVLTKQPDEKSVLTCLAEKKPDVVISNTNIGKTDVFTLLSEAKEQNGFLPKIILMRPYKSAVIDNLASEFNASVLDKNNFTVYDVINEIEKEKTEIIDENKPVNESCDDLKKIIYIKVTEQINKNGIPTNIKGYYYLREAIILCVENDCLISYTKTLCPEIAKKHNASLSSVDRSIRHAINIAWNTNAHIHEKMQHKPTSFQLITAIADFIKTSYVI